MKALVIPEDQTHDAYIIKPVVEAILKDLERAARVDVLPEPRLRGTTDALDPAMIRRIVESNPMIDLFILAVDRDCDRENNEARAAARATEHPGRIIACVARQEVEVWMLALHTELLAGARSGPGAGRKAAMRALAGNLKGLLSRCDELAKLRADIAAWWRA